ncbi:MAG: elongation factor P [Salinivirgaceae bacterium]|nr:elongation factor P [Salinivirgaceae bacterium]
MADTSDLRNGLCIELDGKLYTVVNFLHVKPGKGPAFVRTKLKNLENGKTIDYIFHGDNKIKTVRIERRQYQYLYRDGDSFVFMNTETYDQVNIEGDLIENNDLMKEGQIVDITFHAETEKPLQAEMPPYVELEVTYTEPGVKGDTATNAMKPATVETGATVMVPLFINAGERIKVDTRDRSYGERIK